MCPNSGLLRSILRNILLKTWGKTNSNKSCMYLWNLHVTNYTIFTLIIIIIIIITSVTQEPSSGLGHLIVEDSRSHTIRNTRLIRLLWTNERIVAWAALHTAKTSDKHPCPHRDSNPRSRKQAASDLRRRPHGNGNWPIIIIIIIRQLWKLGPRVRCTHTQ